MLALGPRGLLVDSGLPDVSVDTLDDGVLSIGTIGTIELVRPYLPDIGDIIKSCSHGQPTCLAACVARQRIVHIVIASDRLQSRALSR